MDRNQTADGLHMDCGPETSLLLQQETRFLLQQETCLLMSPVETGDITRAFTIHKTGKSTEEYEDSPIRVEN